MFKSSLLKENTEFADFRIAEKLSSRHDGEREVYLAYAEDGATVLLTNFDVTSARYAAAEGVDSSIPDFIDEIRFMKENANLEGLASYLDSGLDKYVGQTYAWMAQRFAEGESLEDELINRTQLPEGDALKIAKTVAEVIDKTVRFTHGGGHYNISTENIVVNYEGDELKDVYLIGFSNMGTGIGGKNIIDTDTLDMRFRAPETQKAIFNHSCDIYSLGMVTVLMLAGRPDVINADGFSQCVDSPDADMTEVTSQDYYKSLWDKANRSLGNNLRLILGKATDPSPRKRFATMEKLKSFLAKQAKQTNAGEDSADDKVSGLSKDPLKKAVKTGFKSTVDSPAEHKIQNAPGHGLDDVAGMEELKALFRRDFIRIVRNPKVAQAYGIKPSNCTLLYGPQGCGKTFIAEKAAQESGLKYKIVNPAELGSIYIHGSQQKIAELFAEAEKKGPMILIFDEFDALVPKRNEDINVNQANEVNEMLTQLNNCASRGVYVLATTNRPGLLDPAIMRKGRIDRTVYVSLPDAEARAELFRLEMRNRPGIGLDYEALAGATENYTCSDISYIVEEAARLCFEETLNSGLQDPLPISMERLTEVIKATVPSVTEDQRKEYLEVKEKMERIQPKERKKVGFAL